jgi:tripartite-type tricarboxylate transporter receptor subunit TctC
VAAGTPASTIKKLNETLNAIFAEPAVKKRWEEIGSPIVGGTPEQFGSLVLTESVRLGRIVKEANVVVD